MPRERERESERNIFPCILFLAAGINFLPETVQVQGNTFLSVTAIFISLTSTCLQVPGTLQIYFGPCHTFLYHSKGQQDTPSSKWPQI